MKHTVSPNGKPFALSLHACRCGIIVVFSLYRGSSFRKEFSFIGELRSLVSEHTPVMALTATATAVTRHSIVKSLRMIDPSIVFVCPDKRNIKYQVVNISKLQDAFDDLLSQLKQCNVDTPRVIIFCQTYNDCTSFI